MKILTAILFLLALSLSVQPQTRPSETARTPTIAEKVAGMEKFPWLFPILLGREGRKDLAGDR